MTREEAKNMAQSRDCRCVKGDDRDNNYVECIDKIFDYHESEIDKLNTTNDNKQRELFIKLLNYYTGVLDYDEHGKIVDEWFDDVLNK